MVSPLREGRFEQTVVIARLADRRQYESDARIRHLVALEQRLPDLVLKRVFAAVVKQRLSIGYVQEGRCISPDEAPLGAHWRPEFALRERLLRYVTHRAREGAIEGKSAVEEEFATEIDSSRCGGVAGRHRDGRQAQGRVGHHRHQ